MDVEHTEHGPGWVWGSGLGRVTVRFETAETGPGPIGRSRPTIPTSSKPRRSATDDDGRRLSDEPAKPHLVPGRSCAHRQRLRTSTTPMTG